MIYTFIVSYRGGTYIERVLAADVSSATASWAEKIAHDTDIQHLDGAAFRKVYAAEIEEFPPIQIDGAPNVWHLFFFSGKNRMDVHNIKTSEEAEPSEGASLIMGVSATHAS